MRKTILTKTGIVALVVALSTVAGCSSHPALMVSDFEAGRLTTEFGQDWIPVMDSTQGGHSTVNLGVDAGGAQSSRYAMHISAEIRPGLAHAWAGGAFYFNTMPTVPKDVSQYQKIVFWAKGDGRRYAVGAFDKAHMSNPDLEFYTPGPEWRQFSIRLSRFKNIDLKKLSAVAFLNGAGPGSYSLSIDNVEFEQ